MSHTNTAKCAPTHLVPTSTSKTHLVPIPISLKICKNKGSSPPPSHCFQQHSLEEATNLDPIYCRFCRRMPLCQPSAAPPATAHCREFQQIATTRNEAFSKPSLKRFSAANTFSGRKLSVAICAAETSVTVDFSGRYSKLSLMLWISGGYSKPSPIRCINPPLLTQIA